MIKEIEKEIEVVESIIFLLTESLVNDIRHLDYAEAKEAIKDIHTCKIELYKLVAAKEKVLEACKENSKDEVQRSRTIFL